MWKVLIADDEPKIRQGLKSVLEEMKLPITVCAEARNGMEALEKIEQFQPDFILMDICMPKLSGIQFLEELRKLDKNCPVIVISGFNEFSYAKQAIKLGVSEYLLKPIAEEELQAAVVKVTEEIRQKRKSEKFMELVKQQMIQNQDYLRDVFFNEWMEGKLSRFEWEEQARFLDMDFPDNMILILVSVQSSYDKKIDKGTVTEEIYKITLEKIIRELMEPYHTVSVFSSKYEDVAIVMEKLPENFQEFSADLQLQTEEKVGGKCFITARECTFETLPDISREMRREVQKMQECRPIVQDARKYIYANYQDRNLDLRQVAHAIGCNSSYISRIMKQELGISFKDFLTRLRISQAVRLMEDRELSINQIAEKVGYSNQHYFSAAFKNCQGMSPSEFRKNMLQIDRNGL